MLIDDKFRNDFSFLYMKDAEELVKENIKLRLMLKEFADIIKDLDKALFEDDIQVYNIR